CLIILKCEVVSPVLESEIRSDPKIHPLVSRNPYQGNWTIKVRLTSKGNLRTYKNARGEGCVFNVELIDQDGTQIQATMFNEAVNKFYNKFELGKVYYISKGTLKVANKQFKTVQNDYEMNLNENSELEEVSEEGSHIPKEIFNFVKIDDFGTYVNGQVLVDVIGVLQSVSLTMSIKRKANNENIPKRDITIADDSNKTVVFSLWNDLSTTTGQELLDVVDNNPIVAIKCLKVGDFQGVSLSSLGKSTVVVYPDVPKAENLKSWLEPIMYRSELEVSTTSEAPNVSMSWDDMAQENGRLEPVVYKNELEVSTTSEAPNVRKSWDDITRKNGGLAPVVYKSELEGHIYCSPEVDAGQGAGYHTIRLLL
ncbi:hypothetical protein MKX03_016272, partial [Papaver bracteatum]